LIVGLGKRGVTVQEFTRHYPRLYHMAHVDSLEGINQHGLLSTSSLLDHSGYTGQKRSEIEEQHRPNSISLHNSKVSIVVRDQKPMSDEGLRRALPEGFKPAAWYKILNSKVFFWVTEERLHRLLCARAYCGQPHLVLTVDAKPFLTKYWDCVWLTPMNTGCTKPFPHDRGPDTFRRPSDYPFGERVRTHKDDAVVEVAIDGGVPEIMEFVLTARLMRCNKGPKQLPQISILKTIL
jgi:hypothetical protein